MIIGIDARLIDETGVGRYIRNLIEELGTSRDGHTYIVYLKKQSFDAFVLPNEKWEKRCTDIHWHTCMEQIMMPMYYRKDHLDILHVPYFNAPIFYTKPFMLTIHDLTVFHITTGKATKLPYPLYLLKKLGYVILLRIGLSRAKAIIAVSETTKKELVEHFHVVPEKITVTYEGVDKRLQMKDGKSNPKSQIPNPKYTEHPYFLYVGNAYPHKNLALLVHAFGAFIKSNPSHDIYRLLLVGKKDYFYEHIRALVQKNHLDTHVLFLNDVSDEALQSLYRDAKAFVFPSRMEGFGLPALEALASYCPVIASDIPVFHELFGDIPLYFNPTSPDALLKALTKSTEDMHVSRKEIASLLTRFSWKRMADATRMLYETVGNASH